MSSVKSIELNYHDSRKNKNVDIKVDSFSELIEKLREIEIETGVQEEDQIHFMLSGGSSRDKFSYKKHPFKNKTILGETLASLDGVTFHKNGSKTKVDYIIIPTGVEDASESSKKKAKKGAKVVILDDFVSDVLSTSQRKEFKKLL